MFHNGTQGVNPAKNESHARWQKVRFHMLIQLSCGELFSIYNSLLETNPDHPLIKSLSSVLEDIEQVWCPDDCSYCFYQYNVTNHHGNPVIPRCKKPFPVKPTCVDDNYPF